MRCLGGEGLPADEQGAQSAHSQDPFDLFGIDLGLQQCANRGDHTKLAFGQRTLAPRSRFGRSSNIWPSDTSTERAIR